MKRIKERISVFDLIIILGSIFPFFFLISNTGLLDDEVLTLGS